MNSLTKEIIFDRAIKRLIFGAIVGATFGAYIYGTFDRGVFLYFSPTDSYQWNDLFWDNWLLRLIAIIISSSAGSIIAGLIARQKGKMVGVISIVPSILFWIYCFYCLVNNQLDLNIFTVNIIPKSTSPFLIILAIIVNGLAGYFGGLFGENLSSEFSEDFDRKKLSLVGIKWYNYLWYPIIMYFILIEGFYLASYAYERIIILFSLPEYSLSSMLINLVGIPAMIGLILIYQSVIRSYQLISDNATYVETIKGKILLLGLLIVIIPPVSFGLIYLSFYLESLFS